MQLILLEKVASLGLMGDVVRVKPGYARNYLLPQSKALRFSEENKKIFESRKLELEARNLERRKDAESVAEKLEGREFIIIRSASDTGSLYGSVSKRDISDAAAEEGVTLSRLQIELARPIKFLGIHAVQLSLHPEVEVELKINVARSRDEAALQSEGKTIASLAEEMAEEDRREHAEMFDSMGAVLQEDEEDGHAEEEDSQPESELPAA